MSQHIDHARCLVGVLPLSGTVIDLGSGGGLPGLVLAMSRPELRWVLLDAQERRTWWLSEALAQLGIAGEVVHARAEEAGRGQWRGSAAMVTARSFGKPAVTAECAAPLLEVGGTLWVADPRDRPDRWPERGLGELGLVASEVEVERWRGFRQSAPCPDRYPRRVGVPERRPLF